MSSFFLETFKHLYTHKGYRKHKFLFTVAVILTYSLIINKHESALND